MERTRLGNDADRAHSSDIGIQSTRARRAATDLDHVIIGYIGA